MNRLSTKHVVLGLLVNRTSYGYALQQQLAERLSFLELAESAIYKTLDRLEADGCVEQAGIRHSGGYTRRLYRVTPEGVEEFKRWIADPGDPPPLRSELHAKIVLAEPDDLPQLLQAVEGQADACTSQLSQTRAGAVADPTLTDTSWSARANRLVQDFQARRLESLVDWLGNVAREIEEHLETEARAAGAPRVP